MASSTDITAVGTSLGDNRNKHITNDERASAGQNILVDGMFILLSGDGVIGAVNDNTASMTITNSLIRVGRSSTRNRNGAINYGDTNGLANGLVRFVRSSVSNDEDAETDVFFVTAEGTLFTFTVDNTNTKLLRVRSRMDNCIVRCHQAGAIEIHGQATFSGNTLSGVTSGFINFSTGEEVLVEDQNFISATPGVDAVRRLGFINDGLLNFVNTRVNGEEVTLAQIQAFRYGCLRNTATQHVSVSKRRSFQIHVPSGQPAVTRRVRYAGAALPEDNLVSTDNNTELSSLLRLWRTNFASADFATALAGVVPTASQQMLVVTATMPITYRMRAYGYLYEEEEWTSFDAVEVLRSGSVKTLVVDPLISERDASALAGVSQSRTATRTYDLFRLWLAEDLSRAEARVTLRGSELVVNGLDVEFRRQVLSASPVSVRDGALLIDLGGNAGEHITWDGSVSTTGTITLAQNMSVTGSQRSSAGVVFLITGLPASVPASVLAYKPAEGIFANPAYATSDTGVLRILLDQAEYTLRLKARGYSFTEIQIDTTTQATVAVELDQHTYFSGGTPTPVLPVTLTTEQQTLLDGLGMQVVTPTGLGDGLTQITISLPGNYAADTARWNAAQSIYSLAATDYTVILWGLETAMLTQRGMQTKGDYLAGALDIVLTPATGIRFIQAADNTAGVTISFRAFHISEIGDETSVFPFADQSNGRLEFNPHVPSASAPELAAIRAVTDRLDLLLETVMVNNAEVTRFRSSSDSSAAQTEQTRILQIHGMTEAFADPVAPGVAHRRWRDTAMTQGQTSAYAQLGGLYELTEPRTGDPTRRFKTGALEAASTEGGATAQQIWEYADRRLSTGGNADLLEVIQGTGTALREIHDVLDGLLSPVGGGPPTATSIYQFRPETNAAIVAAVWSAATRTLTTGSSSVDPAALAQSVWSYSARTLTASSLTAQQVWEYADRTLTTGALTTEQNATMASLAAMIANSRFTQDALANSPRGLTSSQQAQLLRLTGMLDGATGSVLSTTALANVPSSAIDASEIVTTLLSTPYNGFLPDGTTPLPPGSLGEHWWQFYPPEIIRQLMQFMLDGTLPPTRYQPNQGTTGVGSVGRAWQDVHTMLNRMEGLINSIVAQTQR